ncbi:hypothetical protein [Croceicoccus marinus]|uniref:hypothetical protein n=1 Tax=Croceicoccus marinus TaxID=450378 RepID=UPI001E39C19F|nr:hypothetical protein [Croceicoccus marinus]
MAIYSLESRRQDLAPATAKAHQVPVRQLEREAQQAPLIQMNRLQEVIQASLFELNDSFRAGQLNQNCSTGWITARRLPQALHFISGSTASTRSGFLRRCNSIASSVAFQCAALPQAPQTTLASYPRRAKSVIVSSLIRPIVC